MVDACCVAPWHACLPPGVGLASVACMGVLVLYACVLACTVIVVSGPCVVGIPCERGVGVPASAASLYPSLRRRLHCILHCIPRSAYSVVSGGPASLASTENGTLHRTATACDGVSTDTSRPHKQVTCKRAKWRRRTAKRREKRRRRAKRRERRRRKRRAKRRRKRRARRRRRRRKRRAKRREKRRRAKSEEEEGDEERRAKGDEDEEKSDEEEVQEEQGPKEEQ